MSCSQASRVFPKTYLEFEGKAKQDGTRRRYWIQDLSEEYVPAILDTYPLGFLKDEILSKCSRLHEDPFLLGLYRVALEQIFEEKLTLVCLTEDQGNVKVAGLNTLQVYKEGDEEFVGLPENVKEQIDSLKAVRIVDHIFSVRNPFEEFGVKEIVKARGLYVYPEFRGDGVGQQLLNARKLLCQNLGYKMTITLFTTSISQKLAERAGFKEYVTLDYSSGFPEDMVIPEVYEHVKEAKLMIHTY